MKRKALNTSEKPFLEEKPFPKCLIIKKLGFIQRALNSIVRFM